MRLLVSVRGVGEALLAARQGADFIDLKEPAAGALGGLPLSTIRAIVGALRDQGSTQPLSATIGDLPLHEPTRILQQVDAVAACGVDYVKVGIDALPDAQACTLSLLESLARCGRPVVPVFIADQGVPEAAVARACELHFPALMLDTAGKRAGSLLQRMPAEALQRFVAAVRASGALVGLAGALRLMDLPALQALQPHFVGFRSAVCAGDRSGPLDAALLQTLTRALRDARLSK